MSKTTLSTFIYPSVEPYLNQLIDCINNQTILPDEVLVFNDGLPNAESYFGKLNVEFKIIQTSGSPFRIRLKAFKYFKSINSDIIVFQDSDDLMQSNRVEVVKNKLNDFDLVVNDLSFMNETGEIYLKNIWKEKLPNNFKFTHKFIEDKNIVGLGNTSILKKTLNGFEIKVPHKDVVVADWFIFYQLIYEKNLKSIFTTETTTNYRQHSQNISSLSSIKEERVKKNLEIRKNHYLALQSTGYNVNKQLNKIDYKLENNYNIDSANFWWQ